VTHVESCFADTQDYGSCVTPAQLGTTGLSVVSGAPNAGEVSVSSTGANDYVVTAKSKSNNTFSITKAAGGAPTRSCSGSGGGCKSGTW
jgi:hypothetical protein